MEVLHSSPVRRSTSVPASHSPRVTTELSKRFVSIATTHMDESVAKRSAQCSGHAPSAAAMRGMSSPSRGEGASSGMSPSIADLDSTGDSDRLVIAEEDGSEAGSAASSPETARRSHDRGVREQAGGTAAGIGTEMELEVHAQAELITDHKLVNAAKALGMGQELIVVGGRQTGVSKINDAQKVVEPQLAKATVPAPQRQTEVMQPTVPKDGGVPNSGGPEPAVAQTGLVDDCRDVDSQSNASSDSGREHCTSVRSSDANTKKRRRRKPIKVSKNELSEQNFGDKFDNNYNSLHSQTEHCAKAAEPPAIPECKPATASTGPQSEPKPVSRLMNSFVAKAMKLWYDDELPKTLTSPSKDLNRMVTAPEIKPAQVMEPKPEPPKVKPIVEKEAPPKDIRKAEPVREEISLICDEPPLSGCELSYSDSMPHPHNGVAPDDQYYSTPSQVTPDERRAISGLPEYWSPGRHYVPPKDSTSTKSHQEELPPVGTPLVARAMQSVTSPPPAVSPSLAVSPSVASDHESPVAGSKRYFCNLCNKTFTFRTNLTRHQRAFHGRPCRRRTHDSGSKDDLEPQRTHSLSSEDMDHASDRRDFIEEKPLVKVEPHMDPNYGRFSPSVVSDAKAGRFSPSMPSPSASNTEPKMAIIPVVLPSPSQSQDYIVTTVPEPVACSLCLTTFESQLELNRHEATCRGIERNKLYSDASGAIDLTKPKTIPKPEPAPKVSTPESHPHTYKPKFHYNMSDMLPSSNSSVSKSHVPSPLPTSFLPLPATALHGMPLLPHHIAAVGLTPHHVAGTSSLPLPFSPEAHGRRPYKCTLCTKKYSSYKSLSKHVGYVHKLNLMGSLQQQQQQQQQAASDESMSAMVAMATTEMRRLVKQEALVPSDGALGQYPCKVCGQGFSYMENLQSHYHSVHLGMKDITCGLGSKDSHSPDLAHIGCKTAEWVCDVCGQNFASKRNLNRHLSHVHKLDRKRGALPSGHDGHSLTPIEPKPLVIGVPSYPPPPPPPPPPPIRETAVDLSAVKNGGTKPATHDDVTRHAGPTERVECEKPVIVLNVPAPNLREHPVKLPPKKAIMEEYQKEAELKLKREREQQERLLVHEQRAVSPTSSKDSGVLNLTTSSAVRDFAPREFTDRRPEEVRDGRPALMVLSVPHSPTNDFPPVDLSSSSGKSLVKQEVGKEYYPNPFSAILNLSQTYLRKLLNDTPNPPPHHPDAYSPATIKDKENSIDKDRYGRSLASYRPNVLGTRDYSPETTVRLRDMLSSKGLSVSNHSNSYPSDDSRPGSRNSSLPPSGRSTPVEGVGQSDRRPLVMSSDNHDNNGGYMPPNYNDISPLRMNTANMMALKAKLLDQHNLGPGNFGQLDWKPKAQKKRKNPEYSVDEQVHTDTHQSTVKKPREAIPTAVDGKVPSVDQIKTGEFPAIAIGKRHICGLCGASFTFQTNLTRHQRKLHGKPFVRKSGQTQVKLDGVKSIPDLATHEMALSTVPPTSPTPLTLIKQE